MKRILYSLMLLLGISMFLSSCDKISGGGDDVDEGDFDGIWDTQWEINDTFEMIDYPLGMNYNKTDYDVQFYRSASVRIEGSSITFIDYYRYIKFDGNGYEFDEKTGIVKGKEIKRHDYYEESFAYSFEYKKPHIYIKGINGFDLVSKSKNKMVWHALEDDEDLTLTRRTKK